MITDLSYKTGATERFDGASTDDYVRIGPRRHERRPLETGMNRQ